MLVECVSIEWVTLLPDLSHHLHSIIRQLDSYYKLKVKNLYIRPPHSPQRSRQSVKSGTTNCFVELDDSIDHERLVQLIHRYPFHGHGWHALISRLEFKKCDEITFLTPCKSSFHFSCFSFGVKLLSLISKLFNSNIGILALLA